MLLAITRLLFGLSATKDHPWTYVFVLGEGAGGLHDVI